MDELEKDTTDRVKELIEKPDDHLHVLIKIEREAIDKYSTKAGIKKLVDANFSTMRDYVIGFLQEYHERKK